MILSSLGASLLVFLLGFLGIEAMDGSARGIIQSTNADAARVSAAFIRRQLEDSLERAALLVSLPGMIEAVSVRNVETTRELMRLFMASSPDVDRVFVTSPDGRLWSDVPAAPESMGQAFADREWYRGVARNWQPYVSDVYRRQAAPQLQVISMARAVFGPTREVIGILVFQYRLATITDWIGHLAVGENGRVRILDGAGAIIGSGPGTGDAMAQPFQGLAPFRRALSGSSWSGEFTDPVDGKPAIGTFAPAPLTAGGKEWVVVSAQKKAEALAPTRRAEIQVGIGSLILLTVIFGSTLGLVRRNRRIAVLNEHLESSNQQLENRVQARTAELSALLDASPAFIWYKDRDNKILRVNRPAAQSIGLTRAAVEGRSTHDLYPEEARKYHLDDLEVINSGQSKLNIVEPYQIASGEKRWVRTDKVPYRDEHGNILGVIVFALDVTDLKRAEEALRQSVIQERTARVEAERIGRIKDEFLITLSHELRTPLVPILGWLDLIANSSMTRAEVEEALKVIKRNAMSELQLIDDMLDTARIISGKLTVANDPVELLAVVQAAIETLRLAVDAKHLDLRLIVDQDPGVVAGDAGRLQQVVWNLLGNAIKFTDNHGRITVRVGCREGLAVVAIADSGIGIDPDFLPHVFERFRQADSSTTRTFGGLGLGLALVRHLVEAHGGTITAWSTGAGQGATFTLALPIVAVRLQPAAQNPERGVPGKAGEDPPGRRPQRLVGLKVLVVDDMPDDRNVLIALLRDHGAEVTAACSTKEALAAIVEWHPHVLVSDIAMPGEDGNSLMRRVRSLSNECRTVPAIALTAYSSAEDRKRALEAGFQVHIAKPAESAMLVDVIVKLASGK